jgi:hypothetical protein
LSGGHCRAVSGVRFTAGTSGGSGNLPTPPAVVLIFSVAQKELLDQSYAELKSSVYDALLIQTRFKSVLDQLNIIIDDAGVRLDFTAIEQHFQNKISTNAANGVIDLLEFNRATENLLAGGGWKGYDILENTLRTLTLPSLSPPNYNPCLMNFTSRDLIKAISPKMPAQKTTS